MEQNTTIPEGMDAGAVNLARAIRHKESGGDYNLRGDDNTSAGAYQWNNGDTPLSPGEVPKNFREAAKQYNLDPEDFSAKNQDMVAYHRIKELKDSGKNVLQVAAMWNHGTDKDWESAVGDHRYPDGKVIHYDTPAYVKAVNDYYQDLKAKSVSSNVDIGQGSTDGTQTPDSNSLTGENSGIGSVPGFKQIVQFGTGVGSAIGQGGLNLGKALLKGAQGVADLGTNVLGTPKVDYTPEIQGIDKLSKNIFQDPYKSELSSISGKTGQVVGTVAPYIASGGTTSAVSNTASGMKFLQGIGFLPAAGRVIAGSTAEAALNYAQGYALSGGNSKEAKTQALIAGGFKAGFSTIGEIANAFGIPEKLATQVFKTNKTEIKSVFAGNDSLAKQVVDKGIYGNTEQIATQLTQGMEDSEKQIAQEFEKAGNPNIHIEEPDKFIKYISDKAALLRKAGATQEASGLESSVKAIDPVTGDISANNALGLRRFMDGLRYEKSYLAPTEELNAQQAGLKEMSEEIRHKINQIGGTGDIMKDYSFYIKAMDALAKHASKTANSKGLGIINSFLLGEGIANANPIMAGVGIARKVVGTTKGLTITANVIKNISKSSATGSATRAITSSAAAKGVGLLTKNK